MFCLSDNWIKQFLRKQIRVVEYLMITKNQNPMVHVLESNYYVKFFDITNDVFSTCFSSFLLKIKHIFSQKRQCFPKNIIIRKLRYIYIQVFFFDDTCIKNISLNFKNISKCILRFSQVHAFLSTHYFRRMVF